MSTVRPPIAAGSPDLSIIVVSYNTRDMTLACLEAVAAETVSTSYELIVVDNDSSDGSAAAIAALERADIELIAQDENLGFARANNLAAQRARGRYLLLLNPDTIVRARAIDRLVEFARNCPGAGIWGGRTIFADGSLNPSSCWARMTVWNQFCRAAGLTGIAPANPLFNGEAYGGWQRDDVRAVDIVSGCFLLTETSLWRKLGGFAPELFMYGEDADLCLRAKMLGARPLITPDAEIVHYGGASEKTRAGKMIKLLTAKASLIDRHWVGGSRWLGKLLLQAWPLSRWLALSLLATMRGKTEHREAAGVWREIWEARREWRRGYAQPRSQRAATTPDHVSPTRLPVAAEGST